MKFSTHLACDGGLHRLVVNNQRLVPCEHRTADLVREELLSNFNAMVPAYTCLRLLAGFRRRTIANQAGGGARYMLAQAAPMQGRCETADALRRWLTLRLQGGREGRLGARFWPRHADKFSGLQARLTALVTAAHRFYARAREAVRAADGDVMVNFANLRAGTGADQLEISAAVDLAAAAAATETAFNPALSAGRLAAGFLIGLLGNGVVNVFVKDDETVKVVLAVGGYKSVRQVVLTFAGPDHYGGAARGLDGQLEAVRRPAWWLSGRPTWRVQLRTETVPLSGIAKVDEPGLLRGAGTAGATNACIEIPLSGYLGGWLSLDCPARDTEPSERPPLLISLPASTGAEKFVNFEIGLRMADGIGNSVFCLSSLVRLAVNLHLENVAAHDPLQERSRRAKAVLQYVRRRISQAHDLRHMTADALFVSSRTDGGVEFSFHIQYRRVSYGTLSDSSEAFFRVANPDDLYETNGFPLVRDLLESLRRKEKLNEHYRNRQ